MGTMQFIRCRNRCMSTIFGLIIWCLLFECVFAIPSDTGRKNDQIEATNTRYAAAKPHSLNSRQRRRLQSDSNDQNNLLEGNDVQYQEYQGVFGRPGVDYPVLSGIPVTKFSCRDVQNSHNGYYADLDTNCQVFHVCDGGRKVSFLCPNGTIFRQSHLICDWWFRVECERSPELYEQSLKHLQSEQPGFQQRAAAISNAMQNALTKGATDSMLLESPVSVTNKLEGFNSESELPRSSHRRPINRPTSYNQNQLSSTNQQSSFDQNRQNFANPQAYNQNQQSGNNFNQQPSFSSPLQSQNSVPPHAKPSFFTSNPTRESFANQNGYTTPRVKFATDLNFDIPPRTRFNTLSFNSPTIATSSASSALHERSKVASLPKNTLTDENAAPVLRTRPFSQPADYSFNEISSTPDTLDDYVYSQSPPPPSGTLLLNSTPRFGQNSQLPSQPVSPEQTTNSYSATYSQTKNQHGGTQSQYQTSGLVQTVTPTSITSDQSNIFTPLSQSVTGTLVHPTAGQTNDLHEQQVLAETAAFAGRGKYQDFFYNHENGIPQNGGKANPAFPSTPAPENDKTTLYEQTNAENPVQNLLNTLPASQSFFDKDATKPAVSQFLLNVTLADSNFDTKNTEPAIDHTVTSLLTNETQEAYKQLFPQLIEEILSTRSASDLQSEHSSGLVQSNSPKPQPSAQKSAADIRDLAQIFSRALSAYLEDPEEFRRILSEVRPTEPPSTNLLKSDVEDEVLAFSEDSEKSTPQPPIVVSSTTTRQIRDPETFAEEINNFMIAEPSHADTYPPSRSTIGVSFSVSPLIDYTTSNTTAHPMIIEETTPTPPEEKSSNLHQTTPTFPPFRNFDYSDNDIGLVPPAASAFYQDSYSNGQLNSEQSKVTLDGSYSDSSFSVTSPSTLTTGQTASTLPPKGTLYDEDNTSNKVYPENSQSISEDQLLITADTQSFVSKDNLLAFNNNVRPILKTPAYPQFGIRRKLSTVSQPYQSGDSRAYVIQTTPQPEASNELASTEQQIYVTDALPSSESPASGWNNHRTSTAPLQSSALPIPEFNETAVSAMVNMMEEAQTNPALRSKLVLLLVNDRSLPQHKSVRDLKSKLLKALIVPPKSTIQTLQITQPEFQQQQFAESRQYFQYQTTSSQPPEITTPARELISQTPRQLQLQQKPQLLIQEQPPQIQQFQQSQSHQQQTDNFISRDGRETTLPAPSPSKSSNVECPNAVLSEADARAVDLLKTLYSIAANNWRQ